MLYVVTGRMAAISYFSFLLRSVLTARTLLSSYCLCETMNGVGGDVKSHEPSLPSLHKHPHPHKYTNTSIRMSEPVRFLIDK